MYMVFFVKNPSAFLSEDIAMKEVQKWYAAKFPLNRESIMRSIENDLGPKTSYQGQSGWLGWAVRE